MDIRSVTLVVVGHWWVQVPMAKCFESCDLLGSTRVSSNPDTGTANQKPAASSAAHPFDVGK